MQSLLSHSTVTKTVHVICYGRNVRLMLVLLYYSYFCDNYMYVICRPFFQILAETYLTEFAACQRLLVK